MTPLSIRGNIHAMNHGLPHVLIPNPHWRWVAAIAVILTACSAHKDRPRAPYVPLAELEAVYGPLITAGNHPTGDQSGTGDRLGLFRDAGGTIWGLPLAIMADGTVVGCAPPSVHDAPVTDSYPAVSTVIGCYERANRLARWYRQTGTPAARRAGKDPMARRERLTHRHWPRLLGSRSARAKAAIALLSACAHATRQIEKYETPRVVDPGHMRSLPLATAYKKSRLGDADGQCRQ